MRRACLVHEQKCTLTGHSGYVRSVAYSPDGKHVASASGDAAVRVWGAQTGEEALAEAEAAYSRDLGRGNSREGVGGRREACKVTLLLHHVRHLLLRREGRRGRRQPVPHGEVRAAGEHLW